MSADVIEREGVNCFGCRHRHAGKALAYICIGCPCAFRFCEGCETIVDPETCACGRSIDHGYDNHTAVPMGCCCYRQNAADEKVPL